MAHRKEIQNVECMFCGETPCSCIARSGPRRKRVDLNLVNGRPVAEPEIEVVPEPLVPLSVVEAALPEMIQPPRKSLGKIGSVKEQRPPDLPIGSSKGKLEKLEREVKEVEPEPKPGGEETTYPEALLILFESGLICWKDMAKHHVDLQIPKAEALTLVWRTGRLQAAGGNT